MGRPRNSQPANGDELVALEQAWAERGPEALKTIREADPVGYLRMVARGVVTDLEANVINECSPNEPV